MRLILIVNVIGLFVFITLACGGASAQCMPEWAPGMFGEGMNDPVGALCIYNGELYAGGAFTTAGGADADRIAKWNGGSWQAVGTGMNSYVYALCVYNGELYAGGSFRTAGGVTAGGIARWNGSSWQPVGAGMNYYVYALCVYNGELYAGGAFTTAGGVTANYIAKWNGSSWRPVGTGMGGGSYPCVYALCVCNGELYAAGQFTTAGGVAASYIAKWNGVNWQALGAGMGMGGVSNPRVCALCVYNGELYAGGGFTTAGGVAASCIARWNGVSWQPVGTGTYGYILVLCIYNGELCAGGTFPTAGGVTANYIAKWNGVTWQPVGTGLNGGVQALCVHNGDLYAGGAFTTAGGVNASRVARWNGLSWQPAGTLMMGTVYALCRYDDCSWNWPPPPQALYAGGDFTGLVPAVKYIGRWDGTSWQPVSTGTNGYVYTLCVYNDQLYAGGAFTAAGGWTANRIATWNCSSWRAVGTGTNNTVWALCVYNGELYAGGAFTTAGGITASQIAKWNGASWQPVGAGMNNYVYALCVYNGELYAGGAFTTAGGVSASRIAKWNGVSWQSVGAGMGGDVRALCVYNGELYAGGYFATAGGVAANYIAKWNGVCWQPLGTGMNARVFALCEYDDGWGPGPALYAGGLFTKAGGSASGHIARWGCNITDIASAKTAENARLVRMSGGVSTAIFGDAFYVSKVSNEFQVSGIRAEMPGHGVTLNKLTNVTGRTRTSADGERYIEVFSASCRSYSSVKPEFMPLRTLGGGRCGCQEGVWGWIIEKDPAGKPKRVWGRERGLNNIGMLVRVCGRFAYIDEHTFTLDDGTDIAVRSITPPDVTVSPLWQYVVVTGISSCERVGEELHRRVLVRSADDIQVVPQEPAN